jgi:hypothetical protein
MLRLRVNCNISHVIIKTRKGETKKKARVAKRKSRVESGFVLKVAREGNRWMGVCVSVRP